MGQSPLVSVVIPTHYRNEDLLEAIRSALDQTYDSIEVVVVDDSGEEHARPVVEQFEEVTYLPLAENEGPQRARSEGLEASEGSYVQFLDDDDALLPEKIDRQMKLFENDPSVGVVYCGLRWEDGPDVLPKESVRGDVLEEALRFDTAPCMMGTMLIRRSVLEEVPLTRHSHGADDIGFKIDLARATRFDYLDEVLVRRGDTVDSLSTTWAAIEGRFEVIDTYADLYRQYPSSVRNEALAETYLVKGQRHLHDRRWSFAAVAAFTLATYYVPGIDGVYLSSLVLSLFGRPGYDLSRSLYSRHVLGPARRGKST